MTRCCALLLVGCSALVACDYDVTDVELGDARAKDADVRERRTDASRSAADSGTSDAATGDTDPCVNGTFECMNVRTEVRGDFTVRVTGAVLTAVVDGYTFEARSVDGFAELMLPIERAIWVRTEESHYWPTELVVYVHGSNYEGYVDLLSQKLMDVYFGRIDATLDDTKGYFLAEFFPGRFPGDEPGNIPGASVTLTARSDPPIVNLGAELVRNEALVEGGSPFIHFLNVAPGPFTPTPTAPDHDCIPISSGLPHTMSPRTVVHLAMICTPTTP
jgi:hypothetical protein